MWNKQTKSEKKNCTKIPFFVLADIPKQTNKTKCKYYIYLVARREL